MGIIIILAILVAIFVILFILGLLMPENKSVQLQEEDEE